jgi:hypothetical protein
MNETRCPISWEDFETGEYILRIRNCQHIFNESSLRNWLRLNSYCPVCRCNLRQPIQQSVSNESSDTETEENTEENLEHTPQSSTEEMDLSSNASVSNIQLTRPTMIASIEVSDDASEINEIDFSGNSVVNSINSYRGFMQSLHNILQNMNDDTFTATRRNGDLSGNPLSAEYIIHFR